MYSNSGSLYKAEEDEEEDEDEKGEGDARHAHTTPNNTHEVSENDQMHIVNILEDLLCGNRISREDDHYNGPTVIHEHTAKNDNKNLKNGFEKMKIWSSTITSEHFFTILETLKGHKKVNSIYCFLFSILLEFVFFSSDTFIFFCFFIFFYPSSSSFHFGFLHVLSFVHFCYHSFSYS